MTHRFINADCYASSKAKLRGLNVFAYCLNNPTNYIDSEGEDAIWLQEGENAFGMGHSGLLVEVDEDTWVFFYWGPEDTEAHVAMVVATPSQCVVEPIETGELDMTKLENVIDALKGTGDEFLELRAGELTGMVYLEGNFQNTLTYLMLLKAFYKEIPYNLLTNNCVQQTVLALSTSNPEFLRYYKVVPLLAFDRLVFSAVTGSFLSGKIRVSPDMFLRNHALR